MNDDLKQRLQLLKNKNQEKNKNELIENNILLKECIEALRHNAHILDIEEALLIYNEFKAKLPFTPWGINWKEQKTINNIITIQNEADLEDMCSKDIYYIIWGKGLPIIRCGFNLIMAHLDDIRAVDADTWLFSTGYDKVIEFYHENKITLGYLSNKNSIDN